MKKILLLPFAVLTVFCSSKQSANDSDKLMSDCPADGDCKFEILIDKKLELKRDSNGGNYYQILDNMGTYVVHYQYNRKTDPTLADAGYREEVLFELNSSAPSVELSDTDLSTVKAVFGRYCFCRGQTGLYPIKEGKLSVKKTGEYTNYNFSFKISEVSQIIEDIEFTSK